MCSYISRAAPLVANGLGPALFPTLDARGRTIHDGNSGCAVCFRHLKALHEPTLIMQIGQPGKSGCNNESHSRAACKSLPILLRFLVDRSNPARFCTPR